MLECSGTYTETRLPIQTLTNNTTYHLAKVMAADLVAIQLAKWYVNADEIIEVLDKQGKIVYYLIDRYDRDADYQIKLENRGFVSFTKKSLEYGPVVIPIKYRLSRERGAIKVKDEFTTDLNLGVYGAYRFRKYGVRYLTGETLKEVPSVSFSIAGFINLGTVTLDSLSTTLGTAPLKGEEEETIGVFSSGLGTMLSLGDLQVGLYSGIDFGFGQNAKNWNYNNRLWLGFGVTYNVNRFWKK
ncbi:hypothetical protein [Pedobacter sp. PACM 27299]|uniref:hypothetical protein n=1 Tax=Pedobacter sp. PACM 27299 TaxID=1727164 RepID=UPI0012FBAD03|nr:hypothetical protein [Pedobacter sp. PACM 27299]